jgi:nucleoside-diphosphate-sugar epimerase
MGGTRFNGLALVHELVRTGHDVTIFNRGQTQADLPRGVRRLLGDRKDHAALRAALAREEFDCVYDISAYTEDDVASIVDILRGRTGHYIFASSTAIYAATRILPITEDAAVDRSERQSEYGRNKLLCEALLQRAHREHGFPATIVPFSMVLGPHNIVPEREQRMFARLLRGRPVMIPGDGTTLNQIGHVDDEARALRMLMLQPQSFGKRYNLTGRDCWTDEGYVDVFADAVGVEPRKVFVPHATMDEVFAGRLSFDLGEVGVPGGGGPDQQGRARVSQLIQRLGSPLHDWNANMIFSVDRLRRDLGWKPDFAFRAAVEHTYEWYRRSSRFESSEFDFRWEDALLAYLRGE